MKSVIIPLADWAAGEREFRFSADTEFFQAFENTEILEADVQVCVRARKTGPRKVETEIHLEGTLTVECDRCLEMLPLPVSNVGTLVFRDDVPEDTDFSEDGKEVVPFPEAGKELDLSQAVYDYACLALPMKRVHPDGQCNSKTIRYLGTQEQKDEEAAPSSPFSALKGLFDSK